MDLGMLWLDDGGRADLPSRVAQAAASYRAQYGRAANLCLVNPDLLDAGMGEIAGLRLAPSAALLPNYLWIGQSEEVVAKPAAR